MKSLPCPKCHGTGKVPDQRDIGQKMRDLRLASGLSLRKVAFLLGFTAPYLSDLEHGRRNWSEELQNRYCKITTQ